MDLLRAEIKTIGVAVMIEVAKNPSLHELVMSEFPESRDLIHEKQETNQEWKTKVLDFFRPRMDAVADFLFEQNNNGQKEIGKLVSFYWTYLTQSKGHNDSRNIMIEKGPGLWLDLHSFAIKWDFDPKSAEGFMKQFAVRIPCGACREHWIDLISRKPPNLTSPTTFFEWSVDVHNDVNERLSKKRFTIAEAYALYKINIHDFFDEVYVVNLDRRPDRMAEFEAEIKRCEWPLKKPIRFSAIDAQKVPSPIGWSSGGGAWGCMQSHRHILENAIMNGSDSVLILEDDAVFVEDFARKLFNFLRSVPRPWDKIMLGGQLFGNSRVTQVNEHVRQVVNCQRTHAYAVRGEFMKALYRKWHSSYGHCDHIMGPFQEGWKVYAPTEFIVAQGESLSDISGSHNPIKLWEPPKEAKVHWMKDFSRQEIEEIRSKGFHGGRTLEAGIDVGLLSIKKGQEDGQDFDMGVSRLKDWISMIQWEGRSMRPPRVCMIWCPGMDEKLIKEACGDSLVVSTVEETQKNKSDE